MKLKTTTYKELLSKFDTHIMATKSIRTGNHYTGQIEDFLIFLEEKEVLDINNADKEIISRYFDYLSNRPKKRGTGKLSISTLNDNLSTLRMFSLRMQDEKILKKGMQIPSNFKLDYDTEDNNPFALVRPILSTNEVKLLFDKCSSPLEKSLIALAYGAGLRRGNLERLLESDIDFRQGMVTAYMDKNNKTRRVPLSDFFLNILKDYTIYRLQILASLNSRNNYFFIDLKGDKMSGNRLNRLLKKIINRTENLEIIGKKITLHCLRHSTATHLMDSGESFESVSNFLGHSKIDTVQLYSKRRQIKNSYRI